MRFVSRLHLCAAASILMILYFTWLHRSSAFQRGVTGFWKGSKHRVVVFGNDWSDTGTYRVSSPSQSAVAPRDVDRGEIWVETLCRELACDDIDNYARSLPSNVNADIGSLVDTDIFEQAKHGKSSNDDPSSTDFKTQVQQFLLYEKTRIRIAQRLRRINETTTFVVYFGLWEILGCSTLEKSRALLAIEHSITQLFSSLDTLAENVDTPVKVVIPSMIDVTFLPWVQSMKHATQEHFAEHQHQAVFLWTYWNTVLRRTAKQWQKGMIFMPDPDTLIMEQVRIAQLHSKGILDASGLGKQAPLFEEVEQPCLAVKQDDGAAGLQAAVVEKCADPTQFLFWDDIRLSGSAHQLIGEQAASLICGNQTVNERAMQGSVDGQNSEEQEGGRFELKFPPGY